jgi:hypothetical protein
MRSWGVALLLAAVAAVAFSFAISTRIPDEGLTDLALGRALVEDGALLRREDPLALSTEKTAWAEATPWIRGSWLGQEAAYLAYRASGPRGLLLLDTALLVGACALAHAVARRRAGAVGSIGAAFTVLVALGASSPATTERWSLVLLAAALLLVEALDEKAPSRRLGVALGAVLALSAQLDSGWVAVFGAVALLLATELARRSFPRARVIALALGVGVLSFALHPDGFSAFAHPFAYVFDRGVRSVFGTTTSLSAPVFGTAPGLVVELLVLGLVTLGFTRRFSPRPSDLLITVVFIHEALTVRRAIPYFAVVAAGPLAAGIDSIAPGREAPWFDRLFPAALATSLLAALVPGVSTSLLVEHLDALELARTIREHPGRGNVWHDPELGGALAWAFAGKERIWMDERAELFARAGISREQANIHDAVDAYLDFLARHYLTRVITSPGSAIADTLHYQHWRRVEATPTLILLERP